MFEILTKLEGGLERVVLAYLYLREMNLPLCHEIAAQSV